MQPHSDIVTVTLNPAIDRTIMLTRFLTGSVNRSDGLQSQPGGKGVNVSRMLAGYGLASTVTGFLGKENPRPFREFLENPLIHDEFVWTEGETRVGIKIIDQSKCETTDINFPGLAPSSSDLRKCAEQLRRLARPGRWFVIAGSVPPGVGPDFLLELLALIKNGGGKIAVDTSGWPLQTAIETGVDLVKPNHHELAAYLGRDLPDLASRVAAAVELQARKVPHVIVSLGGDGAIFITPGHALMTAAPPARVASTVGAGDSLLAGYLAGLTTGLSPEACAKLATVFAWCALEDVRRQLPAFEEIEKRVLSIRTRQI